MSNNIFESRPEDGHPAYHPSIMVTEILRFCEDIPAPRLIVDGTLGDAGHTLELWRRFPEAKFVGFDRDAEMIARARARVEGTGFPVYPEPRAGCLTMVQDSFASAAEWLKSRDLQADLILLDLGVSMHHFRTAGRGFSYLDQELDMRLDSTADLTAAIAVNELEETELARIIYEYGEERQSRRLARRIVENRPIKSATELAGIASRALGRKPGPRQIHPATRLFQALRIYVNDELGALERALADLPGTLAPGGILAVLSFHSLEDRPVKRSFRSHGIPRHRVPKAREPVQFVILTPRPLVAGDDEVAKNPASRSAKLRVLQKSFDTE